MIDHELSPFKVLFNICASRSQKKYLFYSKTLLNCHNWRTKQILAL